MAASTLGGAQVAAGAEGQNPPEPVRFEPPVEHRTGEKPWAIVHADFDGDGRPDVATANGNNSISVLFGRGDGTFGSKADYVAPELPYYLGFDLTTADFNGDGKPDIAVAGGNPVGNVLVYLNNGDGSFGRPAVRELGYGPNGVTSADLDGDGNADLVTANNFAADVSVALGRGDGTFGAEHRYEVGPGPQGITVADVTGDDVPDIVTGNFGRVRDSVTVLRGKGDGTFGKRDDHAAGMAVNDVVTGDFDGDGVSDIAAGQFVVNRAAVLLGDGGGRFAPAEQYSIGQAVNEMVAPDLNGDGAQDIVTTVSPDSNRDPGSPPPPDQKGASLSVLLGAGDGTFTDKTVLPPMTGMMSAVESLDANGDGRIDLVSTNLTNNSVVVWLNSGERS